MSDLAAEVGSGDRYRGLVALRDRLAADLEGLDARYVAPVAKQLADVIREIDSLPQSREASTVDDLTSRRKARRAAASGQ